MSSIRPDNSATEAVDVETGPEQTGSDAAEAALDTIERLRRALERITPPGHEVRLSPGARQQPSDARPGSSLENLREAMSRARAVAAPPAADTSAPKSPEFKQLVPHGEPIASHQQLDADEVAHAEVEPGSGVIDRAPNEVDSPESDVDSPSLAREATVEIPAAPDLDAATPAPQPEAIIPIEQLEAELDDVLGSDAADEAANEVAAVDSPPAFASDETQAMAVIDAEDGPSTGSEAFAEPEAIESPKAATGPEVILHQREAAEAFTTPPQIIEPQAKLESSDVQAHREFQPPDEQPHAAEEHASLEELDEKLAGDVQSLLDGDFETIDDVLDRVFHEQASFVQDHFEEPQEVDLGNDHGLEEATGARPTETEEASHRMRTSASIPTPMQAEPRELAQVSPRNDGPEVIEEIEAEESVPPPPDDEVAREVSAAAEAAVVEEIAVEPDADSGAESLPEAAEEEPAVSPQRPGFREFRGFRGLQPILLNIARAINLPMKLVPLRFRPVADYLALTLVFWVPIVWVIAFFVIGK